MGGSLREHHRNTKIDNEEQNKNKKKAYAGEPGSPLSASAVKGETRRSGGTKDEGMKKAISIY